MNTFVKILLIGMMAILLVPNHSFAQSKKERKSEDTRTLASRDDQKMESQNRAVEGFVLIKAVEMDFGKFEIRVHTGVDKEGNERKLASNSKEEERLNRTMESRSLVNMLSFMQKLGYQIESSYSVAVKDEIIHYYLMGNFKGAMNADMPLTDDQMMEQGRANQNRPKLSPEEIEKRKRARQEAQDRR